MPGRGALRFAEVMEGWLRRPEAAARAFGFRIRVTVPGGVRPFGTAAGSVDGTVHLGGLATAAPATGTLEISPWERRRIRYVLDFALDDGTRLRFDGTKRISYARPIRSWTTLPGLVTEAGRPWGRALLRFPVRT
ncbi:MAG TPA: hypothetical protein VE669_06670, partial [Actinomycetota bacterium]|nr:hypothetical protein [Actinomycetota bacterium]